MLYAAGVVLGAGVLWYSTTGSGSVKAVRNDQAKSGERPRYFFISRNPA